MIPRSTAIATAAILLSLFMHFFGVSVTSRVQVQQRAEEAATNEVAVGSAFEDVAETISEPVQPEPAPIPEPEPEPQPAPEPERADTPTSQAQVASANPQRVASPDTGTTQAAQPETTGPSEPELGETPEPTTVQPSSGTENVIAEARANPPDGTDLLTNVPLGNPNGSATPVEAVPVAPVVTPPVAPAPQQLAALPPVVPVSPLQSVTVEPELPPTLVEPIPDTADDTVVDDETAPAERLVTTSLRPRLRVPRPTPEPEGLSDGSPELRDTRLAPSQLIESPLAAYRRDGTDLFAGQRGGVQSGGIGFRNSSGPGNSDVTNYAGQVLVHLNRVRPVAVSGRGWARVFFEINPDGTLASVDIVDGVGSPDIDRAAKAQVRNGVPFPRPPEGKSRRLNFIYRID